MRSGVTGQTLPGESTSEISTDTVTLENVAGHRPVPRYFHRDPPCWSLQNAVLRDMPSHRVTDVSRYRHEAGRCVTWASCRLAANRQLLHLAKPRTEQRHLPLPPSLTFFLPFARSPPSVTEARQMIIYRTLPPSLLSPGNHHCTPALRLRTQQLQCPGPGSAPGRCK